jgi:beta-glucosidase
VLFGNFKPTGKLSFAWPRSMAQVAKHPGDKDYDPLFAFGYGLSY